METLLTGYCRCLDQSRMVFIEEGEPDCDYFCCPHAAACDLAARIRQVLEEEK